jgi:Phage portal protein
MAKPTDNNNTSLFQKVLEAGNAYLDTQIFKAKTTILNSNIEEDFYFGKAIIEDPSYSLHSQGWTDKPYRITNAHLKQMAYQDVAIAAVIQTRQNQVASHATLVKSKQEKGFMIRLKDEDALLEKIKEELKAEMDAETIINGEQNPADQAEAQAAPAEQPEPQDVQKADPSSVTNASVGDMEDDSSLEGTDDENPEDNNKSDDEVELSNFELDRKAREKLNKQFENAKKAVEDYLLNCGKTDNRPFDTIKWNFEAALRSWTRDTLTYDLYATEKVPDRAGRPHHWFPVDGGTIKKASRELRKYKDMAENFFNIDILYPEQTDQMKERQKVIKLDPALLEKDAYKWVQVIRGKVERGYTIDELGVGIRNVNTDIYNNGYGISELELLVQMVTGHINAEYYNQAYFTQGFSAKGILHIKAALNRRKIESVRTQWHHMLKGARNSFQTPIFAGVEDVNWIPLTQNHNDIGFEGWMRYLVTMIGAIYQIDPAEMGIHFKSEGGGGSMGSKDATKEKIDNSKDRGLYPLLTHLQRYINEEIIKPFDSRFIVEFTGTSGEDSIQTLNRQKEEAKFKKTLNEIRAEDGLQPLPGGDDLILGQEYMAWYKDFSPKALAKQKQDQEHQQKQMKSQMDAQMKMHQAGKEEEKPQTEPQDAIYGEGALHMNNQPFVQKSLKKSKPLQIEIYKYEK